MNPFFPWVRCAVALLTVSPALSAPPAAAPAAPAVLPAPSGPAPVNAARIATHLESELMEAHQAIERHGPRLEALLATLQEPSTGTVLTHRANGLVAEARALHSALPGLIRDNEHLFE